MSELIDFEGKRIIIKKGDFVMILEGPMAGAKGEFIRYKGQGRVIIKIEKLKYI